MGGFHCRKPCSMAAERPLYFENRFNWCACWFYMGYGIKNFFPQATAMTSQITWRVDTSVDTCVASAFFAPWSLTEETLLFPCPAKRPHGCGIFIYHTSVVLTSFLGRREKVNFKKTSLELLSKTTAFLEAHLPLS